MLIRFIAVASIFAAPLIVNAQSDGDIRRIGYLANTSLAGSRFVEAFRQGLGALGWTEGQNIVIDYRWSEGRSDRLPDLAAELVRLKPSVIVASPTASAVAAKNATSTIPIVMVSVGDPVRLGLVASLARPGANVTGTTFDVGLEVLGKQLELLKETLPELRRVAILSNPGNPAHQLALKNLRVAAASLRLQIHHLPVRGPEEFDAAFGAMKTASADALLVVADAMFTLHRARLADLAARNRLPSMSGLREFAEGGVLMSYGPIVSEIFRRAAVFVDKILKGASPADLPVEQPTRFELLVNLKTARALGLSISQPVLLRADQVLE